MGKWPRAGSHYQVATIRAIYYHLHTLQSPLVHWGLPRMAPHLRRLDFSRMKKHSNSDTSSTSAPTVPVLESPVAFSVQNISSGPTSKQMSRLERAPVRPSVFMENIEDEEMEAPAVDGPPSDSKSGPTTTGGEDESITRAKTRYFEDVFRIRSPLSSPKSRTSQESIIVIEVKLRPRVRAHTVFVYFRHAASPSG